MGERLLHAYCMRMESRLVGLACGSSFGLSRGSVIETPFEPQTATLVLVKDEPFTRAVYEST